MALRSAGSGKVSRDPVHHPLFARYYARVSVTAESRWGMARVRERLLTGLSGRVIEIGAGNGLNFSHYPGTVSEVVAIEPERLPGSWRWRPPCAARCRSTWCPAPRRRCPSRARPLTPW